MKKIIKWFKNLFCVATFEKVSFQQFKDDIRGIDELGVKFTNQEIVRMYNKIKLPDIATEYSAGHDFFAPFTFKLGSGQSIKFPTGIRCKMKKNYVLLMFPRSGLGFKHRFQLDNTVGVIDADYYYSDNEGHMFAKVTNDSRDKTSVIVDQGQAYMQGVFFKFGRAVRNTSKPMSKRNGGQGSTSKNNV